MTAQPPTTRYLTPWKRSNLKNSLKSSGSSISIVHPAKKLGISDAFGRGARAPILLVTRLVEKRPDRKRGPVHARRGFAHLSAPGWCSTQVQQSKYTNLSPHASTTLPVPPHHPRAEVGELADGLGGAGVVRDHAAAFGGEAEGDGHVERLQRGHLPVEPGLGVAVVVVAPGQAGAHLLHPELPEPLHRVVQARVLVVEPLAEAELRRETGEGAQRLLGRAVGADQAHVEVAEVRRSLALLVAGGGAPR